MTGVDANKQPEGNGVIWAAVITGCFAVFIAVMNITSAVWFPPLSTPSAIVQKTSTPLNYQLQCPQSARTRLAVNQRGKTLNKPVFLRQYPSDENGTSLAFGTEFIVIGYSICAPRYHNANAIILWWLVRITSGGAAQQIGWIGESGPVSSGAIEYNVEPIP